MRNAMLPLLAGLAALALATAPDAAPRRSEMPDGATCTTDESDKACRVGAYCKREFGACVAVPKGEGVCRPIPDLCNDEVKPVCGCNGKTYENACMAEIDDANVAHEGSCNSTDLGQERK